MTRGGRTAWVIAAYALLAILVVPVYPHFISANEISRWILAVAIVDYHEVEVTKVINATHTRMEDLSAVDGRIYSNKAPGGALVGLPAYAIARAMAGPPSRHNMRATLDAMRLLGSTVPVILLALWFAATARRLGCSEDRVTFAVATMLFATPLLAYGLLFFAHALSSFALFGAFALLFVDVEDRRSRLSGPGQAGAPVLHQFLAGALIGLGVLTEYPSAIPAAVLLACALPRLRASGTIRVIAGGLPFALILGVYNRIAFGSFFTLSSAHESNPIFRNLAERGLFGIGVPSPVYLLRLLFDPAKGLFVFSPVLLVAFLGLPAAKRAMPRSAFIALLATPLSILLTYSGYPNWDGGWTVGARYLVPAVPYLALLIAFASKTRIEALLFGASVAVVSIVSLVFPFVGIDYIAPWVTFSLPILRDGNIVPNLFHLVWRPLAIAVPFVIVAIAALIAVPRRSVPLAMAGAVLWFAAGFAVARTRKTPSNIRAVVEEAYFEDRGAIRRALPPDHPNVPRLEAIARSWMKSPPD
ncbi:MAG: hypothetical protein ACXW3E_14510 [Thermoanaerobaculia bacterium]